MKVPLVPTYRSVTSAVPSGFRIDTSAAGIVTADVARLMRSPAVPLKRSSALSPGEAMVTVTGGPPGLIGYAWVALPVRVRVLELPFADAVTEKVTAPRSVGV